jgi:hypothetical protein
MFKTGLESPPAVAAKQGSIPIGCGQYQHASGCKQTVNFPESFDWIANVFDHIIRVYNIKRVCIETRFFYCSNPNGNPIPSSGLDRRRIRVQPLCLPADPLGARREKAAAATYIE